MNYSFCLRICWVIWNQFNKNIERSFILLFLHFTKYFVSNSKMIFDRNLKLLLLIRVLLKSVVFNKVLLKGRLILKFGWKLNKGFVHIGKAIASRHPYKCSASRILQNWSWMWKKHAVKVSWVNAREKTITQNKYARHVIQQYVTPGIYTIYTTGELCPCSCLVVPHHL